MPTSPVGLVVQAEYRGTVVAVKRVIPPKERSAQNKAASSGDGDAATATGMDSSVDMENLNPSISREGPERRKSLDVIFNADEENGAGSGGDDLDLESGTVSTSVSVVKRTGTPINPLGSVDTGVSILSGSKDGNDHHTITSATSAGANGNNKRKKWFGYKSGGKKYEQLKQELIVEMRTLSKLRHPCITTVSLGCMSFSAYFDNPSNLCQILPFASAGHGMCD